MNIQAIKKYGDAPTHVGVAVEVMVPSELAGKFAEAMTGNDDDVLLVAEAALRERVGWGEDEDIELRWPAEPETIIEALEQAGGND
jgi:hypothetical protein